MGPQEGTIDQAAKRMDPTMGHVFDKVKEGLATGKIEKRANKPSEAVFVPSEPRSYY